MLHFFGILTPGSDPERRDDTQKPFFGPEWRLSRSERDAALLSGKLPGASDVAHEAANQPPRFVTLLSPPFL